MKVKKNSENESCTADIDVARCWLIGWENICNI